MPDIFLVNKLQFKQLVDSDQIQDLTEVFEKYASEDTKKILTLSGPEPMETAKFGGKLMGLPWTTLFKENVHLLYIRADWMKNLNLPEPKNMDDVLKISEAFTKQDPDQNGKDDTFGFVFEKTFEFHRGFFNSYHAYLDMWIKDDSGNLVFSNIQPEMKKALEALQHLYKTGQIDREFATKDLTKAAESLSSGKAGMFYGPFSIPVWPLQAGKNLDPNMEYNYYPLLSADDKPATPQYSISG
ncbi:MAG TPA: extracellular solute-binding protein, partial [Clostridiaceae bacterium]|nr:extracellular solute-binding protein [Clostridiaceae bacterium]